MLSKISMVDPTLLPIDLDRAKDRLHVDTNDFDKDLDALLRAAIAAVEQHTGRSLWLSTWEWRADCWSGCCYPVRIPMAPIRDITAIAYLDTNGVEQITDGVNWDWRRTDEGAELWFVSGYSYPTLYDRRGRDRVIVRFLAGYNPAGPEGDQELALDPRLEMAVLFLMSTWFGQREHVSTDQQFEVPDTFKYLANQLRIFR